MQALPFFTLAISIYVNFIGVGADGKHCKKENVKNSNIKNGSLVLDLSAFQAWHVRPWVISESWCFVAMILLDSSIGGSKASCCVVFLANHETTD
jgi:hypothetical protein